MHFKIMTYHFSPIKMIKINVIPTAGKGVDIFIQCLKIFSYIANWQYLSVFFKIVILFNAVILLSDVCLLKK